MNSEMKELLTELEVFAASDEKAIQDYVQTARAVVVVDLATHRIIYITRVAEQLFGYHMHNELRGLPLNTLIPESKHGAHTGHLKEYDKNPHSRPMGETHMKLVGKRRNGSEFPVEIHLESMVLRGHRIGIAIISAMDKKQANHEE